MRKKCGGVYQFRIALKGIEPPVWRRIQLPETYSFWDLHVAIQDSMGWQDYHLHEFEMVRPGTKKKARIGIPDEEDAMFGGRVLAGWNQKVSDWFSSDNPVAQYKYDFGDGWVHEVGLEKIFEREEGVRYPACVDGKRACPPEDCGGVHGYCNLLRSLNDTDDPQHDNLKEWVGGSFDPDAFNASRIQFDDPDKRWRMAFEEGDESVEEEDDDENHAGGKAVGKAILDAVEKQIEERTPPEAADALDRLMKCGESCENAVMRIARVLAKEMYDVMKSNQPYNEERYIASLKRLGTKDYGTLPDEDLVDLLFTEGDTLSREAIDELIRRGDRIVGELGGIVEDESWWVVDSVGWWAVVHAVFILGAIGGEKVCAPLLRANILADQYDNDWIYEAMPSILGSLPPSVANDLKGMTSAKYLGWFPRTKAAQGLAALTLQHPDMTEEIFRFIGEIFLDEKEDGELRDQIGNILLDFRRTEYRDALLERGKELKKSGVGVSFTDDDVRRALSDNFRDLFWYRYEWLKFYDPSEITKRQKRWEEEARQQKAGIDSQSAAQRVLSDGEYPYVRPQEKLGRNEPCFCGSGKKFKQCCIGKVH